MRVIRFSHLLALVMLFIVAGTTWGQDNPERLFSPEAAPAGEQPVSTLGGPRRRYVEVDVALLSAPAGQDDVAGRRLQLDLFEGASYTAVAEYGSSSADGQIVWQGQMQDEGQGAVTIVANDGVAAGSIRAGDQLLRLYYAGDGVHVLEEVGAAEPLAEHAPIPVEPAESLTDNQDGGQAVAEDDGSVIDVLVVYTAASKNRYGGRTGIEAVIDLALAETNQAYTKSQINTQLSLAATAEVSYVESGSMVEDLYRLQRKNDGYLESVHQWRDTYAADMVVLIQEAKDYCGIAFLMTDLAHSFESHAFSVVDSDCATGYYSFGHELGHNMGSTHDRQNGGSALFNYSYGYWAPDYSFRTIMAYNCPGGCIRVQRFSNPDVLYNGQPTGIRYSSNPSNAANNARSINEARLTVANWRDSPMPRLAAPTSLSAVAQSPTQIHLSWQDNAGGELGYEVQRRLPGHSWSQIADLPPDTTGYDDNGRSPDTTYEYRVRSYANGVTSDYSNVAGATTPRYPEVHIGAIDGGGSVESNPAEGGTTWRASVLIKVHDAYHGPVNGAAVSGTWSGGVSGNDVCVTDSSGRCAVIRSSLGASVNSATFSVSSIVNGGDPYLPDHNHDPAGDGLTATAYRPTEANYLPFVGSGF